MFLAKTTSGSRTGIDFNCSILSLFETSKVQIFLLEYLNKFPDLVRSIASLAKREGNGFYFEEEDLLFLES